MSIRNSEIFVRYKNFILLSILILLPLLVLAGMLLWKNGEQTWYGYVVGEDRKIYMVNLATGELEWISREFEQIGRPTHIEINREESILYIASERGRWQMSYVPLIAVKLNGSAEVIYETNIDPDYVIGSLDVSAVYELTLDAKGEALYAAFCQ